MIEKEHFLKPFNIEISAATIGINREDWFCHRPNDIQKNTIRIMEIEKFDIVPILAKDGQCKKFYTLNGGNLIANDINENDRLYYLTHIRDVIWLMNKNKRTHYFLSNGRNENNIVGLLSLSNLNSRDFYLYLFYMISFLELAFSNLIKNSKKEAFEILKTNANVPELRSQIAEIEKRISEDEENGIENDYREYLYLSNLITLIKNGEQFKLLGYQKVTDFEKHIGILNNLRNNVAHPVKSLVRNFDDLQKLNKGIEKIFELVTKIKLNQNMQTNIYQKNVYDNSRKI